MRGSHVFMTNFIQICSYIIEKNTRKLPKASKRSHLTSSINKIIMCFTFIDWPMKIPTQDTKNVNSLIHVFLLKTFLACKVIFDLKYNI